MNINYKTLLACTAKQPLSSCNLDAARQSRFHRHSIISRFHILNDGCLFSKRNHLATIVVVIIVMANSPFRFAYNLSVLILTIFTISSYSARRHATIVDAALVVQRPNLYERRSSQSSKKQPPPLEHSQIPSRQSTVIPCPDLLPPVPFLTYQIPTPTTALTNIDLASFPIPALPHRSETNTKVQANLIRISNGRPGDYALSSYLAFVVTSNTSVARNHRESHLSGTTETYRTITCTATLLTPTVVLTVTACTPNNQTLVYVGGLSATSGEQRNVRRWQTLSSHSHSLIIIFLTQPVPSWMRFMSADSNLTATYIGNSFRVAGYGTANVNSIHDTLLTYVDATVQPFTSCQTAFALPASQSQSVMSMSNSTHMCLHTSACFACVGDLGAPVFLPDVAGAPVLYGLVIEPLWPPNSSSLTCAQPVETQPVFINVVKIAPFVSQLNSESRPTTPPTSSASMTPKPSPSMMAARRPERKPYVAVIVGMAASIVVAACCCLLALCLSCRVGINSRNCSSETRARHVVLTKDSGDAASANASVKWPPEAVRSDGTRSGAPIFASRGESLEETRRNLAIADWLRASGSVSGAISNGDTECKGKDRKRGRKNERRVDAHHVMDSSASTQRHGQGQTVESRRRAVSDWLRSNAIARDARGNPSGSEPLGDA